jgi:hypothetical protein
MKATLGGEKMGERKHSNWMFLLPILFGILGGIIAALASLDDEVFAMKQMIVGLTITMLVMSLSMI